MPLSDTLIQLLNECYSQVANDFAERVAEKMSDRGRMKTVCSQPTAIATLACASPGDIKTEPREKLWFNAPYNNKHIYNIKITNTSARRIGWFIKVTNVKRLGVDPACGVLDPKESSLMTVICEAFAIDQEESLNDRITIEWTNSPEGSTKQFRREWFQSDGVVRRKNITIEYNL